MAPASVTDGRRRGSKRCSEHGINKQKVLLMTGFTAVGILLSLGHHLFYAYLDGRDAPNIRQQEVNLGIGNAFGRLVQGFLAAAVAFFYTQTVFTTLRAKPLPLKGIDAAFNATNSFLELRHAELLMLRGGVLFLVLFWALSLPGLVTTATLTVQAVNVTSSGALSVPIPNIFDPVQAYRYAYFVYLNVSDPNAAQGSLAFEGPRTILTRLSTATASSGAILIIPGPSAHSQYELSFRAPYVMCSDNDSIANTISQLLQAKNDQLADRGNNESWAYYAFVPAYNTTSLNSSQPTISLPDGRNLTALDQPRLQEASRNATNELWMTFWRYLTDANGQYVLNSDGSMIPQQHYSVCTLWDANYTARFSFHSGVQTIEDLGVQVLNQITYPEIDPTVTSDLMRLSYTAYFSVLADQLVGSMGMVFVNLANGSWVPSYSDIDTQIEHSSLIGSNDLDYVFNLNQEAQGQAPNLISKPHSLSDQRLLDKALAQNQTLPFLIQQLAFNTTISMMNDPLLSTSTMTNVTQTVSVNRYHYNARNLWLAYGPADILVLIALIVGVFVVRSEHATHNSSVSSILSLSHSLPIREMFAPCCEYHFPPTKEAKGVSLQITGHGVAGLGFGRVRERMGRDRQGWSDDQMLKRLPADRNESTAPLNVAGGEGED